MIATVLSRPKLDASGLAALEARWRAFARAGGASFFQDWTWVGCLAARRFPDPVLLELYEDGRVVGLALFNRRLSRLRGDALYLHESNDPVLDSIFTEHNGPVLLPCTGADESVLLRRLIEGAMTAPVAGKPVRKRRLVLSGVSPACAEAARAAGRVVGEERVRQAPFIRFGDLPPDQPFIETLSRNTRHQLRRSLRAYAAKGPLTLHRAETVDQAMQAMEHLIGLHSATWESRGKPGAFATPAVRRFHNTLIARGVPTGEVDVLRVQAGDLLIGYLLNFTHAGQVFAYQSGFNYVDAARNEKPGLTAHYLAIEHYRQAGMQTYDFLAGPDRYKLSLSNAERPLHWLTVSPDDSWAGLGGRLGHVLPRVRFLPKSGASALHKTATP